MNKVIKSFNKA